MFKRSIQSILMAGCLVLGLGSAAQAKSKVVGAYPYIQDLVKQVAGSELGKSIEVNSLATGDWDPHFIVAKPSLLSKLRRADLLIINGGQLEIGWLPPLMRQANNGDIQPGQQGFLDLSDFATLIQKPQNVSRAMGDVHPQGNPHFVLDPLNVPKLSTAITQKLCQLENASCGKYKQNNSRFLKRWNSSQAQWKKRMAKLNGMKVVEYHRLHDYFFQRYGLNLVGTLEPLPGIPPTPQHLAKLSREMKKQGVKIQVRGVFHPQDPSKLVQRQTQAKVVTLPHDVAAVPEAKDIFGLYESILKRLGV